MKRKRRNRFKGAGFLVAVLGVIATCLTVPEFRRAIGLDSGTPTGSSSVVANANAVAITGQGTPNGENSPSPNIAIAIARSSASTGPQMQTTRAEQGTPVYISGNSNEIKIESRRGSALEKRYVFADDGHKITLNLPPRTQITLYLSGANNNISISEELDLAGSYDTGLNNRIRDSSLTK